MRALLLLVVMCTLAHAQPSQIRVDVECEQAGRTKFCPAFLLGFVDANKVLLSSPRAGADVVVYATANPVALDDQVHLRFVGHMPGAPEVIELDVMVDTRMTDDQQRAVIEPSFLRGIALFVAARYPEALNVSLTTPKEMATGAVDTSPWGFAVTLAGNGNYTHKYKSANGELDLKGTFLEREFRALALVSVSGGLNYQPPLMLDDGSTVSLDTRIWQINFGGEAIRLLNDTWSVGFGWYTGISDPKAQYAYNGHARGALEYDVFPADDPRGNRLGVFYHLGWAYERYNIRNVLGENYAHYPVSGIDAVGSVRHDGLSYGLTLSSDFELDHPGRRVPPAADDLLGRTGGVGVLLAVPCDVLPRRSIRLSFVAARPPGRRKCRVQRGDQRGVAAGCTRTDERMGVVREVRQLRLDLVGGVRRWRIPRHVEERGIPRDQDREAVAADRVPLPGRLAQLRQVPVDVLLARRRWDVRWRWHALVRVARRQRLCDRTR